MAALNVNNYIRKKKEPGWKWMVEPRRLELLTF